LPWVIFSQSLVTSTPTDSQLRGNQAFNKLILSMEAESEEKPKLEPDYTGPDSSQGTPRTAKYSISPTKVFLALVLAGITGLGILCWMCLYNPGIAFLPQRPGAEWIVYPSPPVAIAQRFIPLMATFRQDFKLDTLPPSAVVNICAFRNFSVLVNGHTAQVVHEDENWKSASTLDITRNLRVGANEIMVSVTNSQGPPVLWLQFHGGDLSFGTGKDWSVSRAGSPWQNAVAATQRPAITQGNPFFGESRMLAPIIQAWPLLFLFCALSIISVFAMDSWLRKHSGTDRNTLVNALLVLVIIARVALFINDAPQLPRFVGFDAAAHEEYVRFIQEKHALPTGAVGWETYQPPLYYVCAAGLLNCLGLSAGDSAATFVLRSINGFVGVIQCVLSLLCLRALFPKNAGAQAAGLLVAAFIPPQLYLSDFVTNELLSGLFATTTLYFLLLIIRTEDEKPLLYLWLGASLGAALLTKSSSLPLLPFIILALGLRFHWHHRQARDWFWYTGIFLAPCLVVCGLFYGKTLWGYVVVVPSFWQYPGFRTIAYYCHFGHVFIAPLSGGIFSFGSM
jgi:Dolichyl-phosphate-mannose-protein mannosyltransferase